MKRREFVNYTKPLLTAPILMQTGLLRAFNSYDLFSALSCDTVQDRFLVVVQLKGANDGFNTIIKDDRKIFKAYRESRPNIFDNRFSDQLIESQSLKNTLLHPSLGALQHYCWKEAGSMKVINSVGYAQMNRSHFGSTDLWLTGGDGENKRIQGFGRSDVRTSSSINEGWMAKYLETLHNGYQGRDNTFMPDPLGIHMSSKSKSIGFHSREDHMTSINMGVERDGFYALLTDDGIDQNNTMNSADVSDRLSFMNRVDETTKKYGSRINCVFEEGRNALEDYPSHDLAKQFKTIARLANGGCQTKIYLTELPGFDTHAKQLPVHGRLLKELSESVAHFMEDLEALNLLDKCLIVTFSEFGRKFVGNESNGTDHGTLAPMFIFGNEKNVETGSIGPEINLQKLDHQGAPYVPEINNGEYVDYRDVFKNILNQWLGASPEVLANAFSARPNYPEKNSKDFIPIIRKSKSAADIPIRECYENSNIQECVD